MTERVEQIPTPPVTPATFATIVAMALVCAAAGPRFAFVPDARGILWLPAGIGVASTLTWGWRTWPALFFGALVAGLLAHIDGRTALAFAASATAEGLLGSWLTVRVARGRSMMERTRTFVTFAMGVAPAASLAGPLFARLALRLLDRSVVGPALPSLASWWLGDLVSMVVTVPVLLALPRTAVGAASARGTGEHVAAAAALGVAWYASFGGESRALSYAPLDVLCVPPMMWVAYRFGPRAAALAVSGVAAIALQGTLAGYGPFAAPSAPMAVTPLHAFVGVIALTTFTLAIVTNERRAAELELERAARTDALTGLSNYGRFMESLEAELARALRTGQGFALLFVDLDGLKRINDSFGHLAGNRALRLVASAMRSSCRAIDTTARLGGDEFCALLPESDEAAARTVAHRIDGALQAAAHEPPVTVSMGVALFPRDGGTPQALLAAADSLLYGAKARRSLPSRTQLPA